MTDTPTTPQRRPGIEEQLGPIWEYVKYQPFLMAFFYVCLETLRDPMYHWPIQLVWNAFGFYFMALITSPLWVVIYYFVVEKHCKKRASQEGSNDGFCLVVGAVPLLALPLMTRLAMGVVSGEHILYMMLLILIGILSSVIGTALYLRRHAQRGSVASPPKNLPEHLRYFALPLLLGGALLVTVILSQVILHTPNLPWVRSRLAQFTSAEVAAEARNVYAFKLRGYFLASGDPDRYHFRFDADGATINALVLSAGEKEGIPLHPEEESIRRRIPRWWRGERLQYYRFQSRNIWINQENNRVFMEVRDSR